MMNIVFSLKDLKRTAEKIIKQLNSCRIITFSGSLGSGKTTLIREILRQFGIEKNIITSPTFAYMNIYKNKQGKIFYHFDLYRINSLAGFYAQGFDEFLNSDTGYCFIEWPEIIKSILEGKKVCHIKLEHENGKRRLIIKKFK